MIDKSWQDGLRTTLATLEKIPADKYEQHFRLRHVLAQVFRIHCPNDQSDENFIESIQSYLGNLQAVQVIAQHFGYPTAVTDLIRATHDNEVNLIKELSKID